MTEKLFALDIGTRSVVGIILEVVNDHFHVVDILTKEHKERAMVDGQIHNVVYVAELIQEIKQELEQTHGPLTKVSVAAAGRALKTEQAHITTTIKNRPMLTEEDISRMELQAVQEAQAQLLQHKQETATSHYYCVGYSVMHYTLDGEDIGSLIDQQGHEAGVEVIATFLPRVVVESLLAALKRADLEMEALTLEPIAAINVLIPPSMRRLNVALVDIGAGTSDIAITDAGTVVAYGMVPTAGDEITESLSDHYLLDFHVAEEAKRQIQVADVITIQDILGFETQFDKQEVVASILPAVKNLAAAIGTEILRLNNQIAPKAVMLVGGGSLTPELPTLLGEVLQLPKNRVAVRGADAIQNLTKETHIPLTPEMVTPIGIAIAAKKAPVQYMSITVNGQVVRLFELKEMTVGDAFLAANIRAKQLYGKPGLGLSITVNGQDIFIPGQHGEPAQIFVNGKAASTKTLIKSGDIIELQEGKNGEAAIATVQEILDSAATIDLTIQGITHQLQPALFINDVEASLSTILKDRDQLTIQAIETVEHALHATNQQFFEEQLVPFQVTVNGQPVQLAQYSSQLEVNGLPAKLHYPIKSKDIITFKQAPSPTAQHIAQFLNIQLQDEITVTFQNETIQLQRTKQEFVVNGQAVTPETFIRNGSTLHVNVLEADAWTFQDVFRFSTWQLPTAFKGNFTILRNGEPAKFDSEIFGGDILEIQLIEQAH